MAEDVHARLRVGREPRQRRKDDAGRPEDDRELPGPRDADTERGRRLVARAGRTRDIRRLIRGRKPLAGKLERVDHLLAPPAARDVEEQRTRRVGDVDCALAEELEPHVVLREQHRADAREDVRLVRAQPQQLRRRESGERPVPRQRDQAVEAEAPLDLGALGCGALVVPEDRRSQGPVVGAERDEPVHLAGEADCFGLDAEGAERRLGGAHPVVRVLLGPARLRCRKGIWLLRPRDDLAVLVDRDRLDAGRADVEPDEHQAPSAAYTSS